MFKKVLFGALIVGLTSVLVVGAVNRTVSKTAQVTEAFGQGQGQGGHGQDVAYGSSATASDAAYSNYGQGGGNGGQGQSNGQGGNGGQGSGNGQGSNGNGQGNGNGNGQGGQGNGQGGDGAGYATGDQAGTGQAQVDEWVMLEGAVVSADANALVVQIDAGAELVVDGRAWSFAQEQGFSAQVGDAVTLTGFYESGDFEVGQIEDATNALSVSLRDETGRPLWAGRGRGRA